MNIFDYRCKGKHKFRIRECFSGLLFCTFPNYSYLCPVHFDARTFLFAQSLHELEPQKVKGAKSKHVGACVYNAGITVVFWGSSKPVQRMVNACAFLLP